MVNISINYFIFITRFNPEFPLLNCLFMFLFIFIFLLGYRFLGSHLDIRLYATKNMFSYYPFQRFNHFKISIKLIF